MTDVEAFSRELRSETRLIWIETPTNPTLTVVDIAEISRVARAFNRDIIIAVDNTFATPYFQRPLLLGADIVSHSATKYLNGHCDVVMGMVATSSDILLERLLFLQNALGSTPSPFDCYLVMRGMRTLHVRMQRHAENALKVATFLRDHPRIKRVLYPGLPCHPQHDLVERQQSGHGGIVSFILDGSLGEVCKFAQSTTVFTLAESLGGVESLIDIPQMMTHGSVPADERAALGICETFVRLSVGLENGDDLVADLDQAISSAFAQDHACAPPIDDTIAM